MNDNGAGSTADDARRGAPAWLIALVALGLACAVPVASKAYDELVQVNRQARERLILVHRLWELEPAYRGKPENWARFASRLLNDRQLLSRVQAKYGAQAAEIELEYRRDLAIARAEVVVVALALWAAPICVLGAVLWRVRRRQPAPPQKVQPPSASDPRYRPPES